MKSQPATAQTLPDVIGPGLDVLFCGINPGQGAAAAGHHFVGRGNRFWRVVHLAGFTPTLMTPQDDHRMLVHGCGLTTAVSRCTARAAQLAEAEFIAAKAQLAEKIHRYQPRRVAFLGKQAYAAMTGQRDIAWGLQSTPFAHAEAWVLPNPSGLNRSFSLDALVCAYRELALTRSAGRAPSARASRSLR